MVYGGFNEITCRQPHVISGDLISTLSRKVANVARNFLMASRELNIDNVMDRIAFLQHSQNHVIALARQIYDVTHWKSPLKSLDALLSSCMLCFFAEYLLSAATRLRENRKSTRSTCKKRRKTSSTTFQRRKETLFERLQRRRRKISRITEAISPPRGPSPRNSADSHLYGRRNTKFVLLEKTKWIFTCGTSWLALATFSYRGAFPCSFASYGFLREMKK